MAPQSIQLVMRTGPTPGKVYAINKTENIIGRDTTCDIVINDSEISRKHARLVINPGNYLLEDLGSTNGTFVNGQRLMGPHSLRSGELVMFGENVSLTFEVSQFDPGATVISGGLNPQPAQEPPLEAAPPPEAFAQSQPPQPPPPSPFQPVQPPPSPAYVGQVPAGPADFEAPPPPAAPPKKSSRVWLFAGCGCLIILLCVVLIALAFYIDSNNLWCNVLPMLPGCPVK